MILKKLLMFAAVAVVFTSCTEDDLGNNDLPLGAYDNGLLILNQGNFGQDNSSISFLSNDFTTFQSSAFLTVNPTKVLGNTGQDIGFYDNLAFVVVNGSNKIEIVNRYTLEHVGTIASGLDNPRYIAFANGKGYVTNWGDGGNTTDDYVAVLDLSSYSVSSSISVAEGPERIIANDDKLYVAHQGGYGFGNTISVINATSNTVTSSITVGDVPNSMQIENDILYVLCGGKPSYAATETAGKLVKISLASNSVTSSIDFAAATHPSNLSIANNTIYYTLGTDVFKTGLTATSLPTLKFFSVSNEGVNSIFSFAANNGRFYVGDAGDYNSSGEVYVYSGTGTLMDSFTVGVSPGGFYFN